MSDAGTPVTVCRVVPPGYEHHRAFDEIVETLFHGVSALGHPVKVVDNEFGADGLTIVVGAHLLNSEVADALTPATVVYNFEQIDVQTGWTEPHRLRGLRRAIVWDYSARNLEYIRAFTGNTRLVHVPVGYVPHLTRIDSAALQDIDVLFYGSLNDRRRHVIDAIARRGLNVQTTFGTYGAARDGLIARAKVVLNLHYYLARVFEIVRVSYLLANRKAVVAECGLDTEIDDDLRDGVRLAAYDDLPGACEELVADAALRRRYEEAGFACMASRPASDLLRGPLADALRTVA